jgi:hypothetical protein
VQWHPEDQVIAHPVQLRLFERFAEALEEVNGTRKPLADARGSEFRFAQFE